MLICETVSQNTCFTDEQNYECYDISFAETVKQSYKYLFYIVECIKFFNKSNMFKGNELPLIEPQCIPLLALCQSWLLFSRDCIAQSLLICVPCVLVSTTSPCCGQSLWPVAVQNANMCMDLPRKSHACSKAPAYSVSIFYNKHITDPSSHVPRKDVRLKLQP